MRRRLLRPRELARQLRLRARREPDEVEEYLEEHGADWVAIAEATPGDAADILEAISEQAAGELVTELSVDDAAEVLEELRDDLAAEILLELDPSVASEILSEMPPEEAVDILEQLERDEINALLELVDDNHDLAAFFQVTGTGLSRNCSAWPGVRSDVDRFRWAHPDELA